MDADTHILLPTHSFHSKYFVKFMHILVQNNLYFNEKFFFPFRLHFFFSSSLPCQWINDENTEMKMKILPHMLVVCEFSVSVREEQIAQCQRMEWFNASVHVFNHQKTAAIKPKKYFYFIQISDASHPLYCYYALKLNITTMSIDTLKFSIIISLIIQLFFSFGTQIWLSCFRQILTEQCTLTY